MGCIVAFRNDDQTDEMKVTEDMGCSGLSFQGNRFTLPYKLCDSMEQLPTLYLLQQNPCTPFELLRLLKTIVVHLLLDSRKEES